MLLSPVFDFAHSEYCFIILLCPALYDHMDCSPQGSSAHGILQARYQSGLPCPPPGALPDRGIEPMSCMSPALAVGFFTTCATWEAQMKP